MTSPAYEIIDSAILDAVLGARSPLTDTRVCALAEVLTRETKREAFRVIDARLQSLRKAGKIHYVRNAQVSKGEWRLGAKK